jgi:uncharacterized repeat protein (TIGR01451 family)
MAGEQVTYTITIRNNGPSTASATVSDLLSTDLSFVSCNAPLGVCGGVGNNRSVTFANVPDGATRTFTLVATVQCDTPDTVFIPNTATVTSSKTDNNPANDAASSSTTVDNPAPIIDVSIDLASLWPVMHDLELVGLSATADDGPCPAPTEFDVTVFSNEEDETPNPPFSPDALNIDLSTLRLRSERTGAGDGRVYLIVVKATDDADQTGFATITVVVSKSQSQNDEAQVSALASAAKAFADANGGAAPAGYFLVGDGPVLGPKQ